MTDAELDEWEEEAKQDQEPEVEGKNTLRPFQQIYVSYTLKLIQALRTERETSKALGYENAKLRARAALDKVKDAVKEKVK